RVGHVTGVQTCALPFFRLEALVALPGPRAEPLPAPPRLRLVVRDDLPRALPDRDRPPRPRFSPRARETVAPAARDPARPRGRRQIGRASCRERGGMSGA